MKLTEEQHRDLTVDISVAKEIAIEAQLDPDKDSYDHYGMMERLKFRLRTALALIEYGETPIRFTEDGTPVMRCG